MPLTGMQIYKSLPKTNCKDCGLPTCMAFAMQVAAQQRALEDCPHVSEEASSSLSESSAPPTRGFASRPALTRGGHARGAAVAFTRRVNSASSA